MGRTPHEEVFATNDYDSDADCYRLNPNHLSTTSTSTLSTTSSTLRARRNKTGLELDMLQFVQESTPAVAKLDSNLHLSVHSLRDLEMHLERLLCSPRGFDSDFAMAQQSPLNNQPEFAEHVPPARLRYANIRALASTRVRLLSFDDSDFIHANFVTLPMLVDEHKVIVTQSPLQGTAEHFWQMCWEQRVPVIIMLNEFHEMGRDAVFAYFCEHAGSVLQCGKFSINTVKVVSDKYRGWRETELELVFNGEKRRVTHLHCVEWQDFMQLNQANMDGLKHAFKVMAQQQRGEINVVHCSAGLGRSGTLVAIYAMLELARNGKWIAPAQLVQELRKQRHGMVQTVQQYRMIYEVSVALLKEGFHTRLS